ncbi:aspartate kinase [Francisella philomiragia]|uniref:aspartate kinase n=1 Tax=Francisella philomiragia TaxID=28110 RepID=UPI001902F49A|nr:aspartate kinase [Francisella philomiragia]MBK2024820.1 aspartate kinase [Francisella philomiragia]
MKKQISVAKFGGTSVAIIAAIYKCVDIVKNNEDIKVVVVSAQAGVTNLLEKLIKSDIYGYKKIFKDLHLIIDPIVESVLPAESSNVENLFSELEEFCQRLYISQELDLRLQSQILSFGERVSAYIFNQVLREQGINCEHIDARKIIKADGGYIEAKPLLENIKNQARKYLSDSEKIYVMGGFIGSNLDNETILLGRGGSDYSAALIAEAINANMLYIWTDVAGIHQADPRLIPKSRVIRQINFEEAIELISFGAKVLHPDTLWPVIRSGTKVFVGSTFDPDKGGTYIVDNQELVNRDGVRAITEKHEQILMKIKLQDRDISDVAPDIFSLLKKYGVTPVIVSLSDKEFSFVINRLDKFIENSVISDLTALHLDCFEFERNLSLTALIGNGLDKIPQLFKDLSDRLGISSSKLVGYGAKGNSLYFLTESDNTLLQRVYDEIFKN